VGSNGLRYSATYTAPADSKGDVDWTVGNWTDLAGNAGSTQGTPPPITFDTSSPIIQSMVLVNGLNKPLKAGESVDIEVTFSEAVTVSGSPELKLQVGTGAESSARYNQAKANFNGTVHIWRYTVQAGDNDTDGIAVAQDKLSLGTGIIQDNAGNRAVLTHSSITSTVLVDTTAPTLSLSYAGTDTLLALGETATITARFSETPATLPNLTVSSGSVQTQTGTTDTLWTNVSGNEYTTVFTPGANLNNGTVSFNIGAWADAAGNAGYAGEVALTDNKTIRVDTVAPTVTGVTGQSLLATNTDISFVVTLSEAISGTWSTDNFTASNGTVSSVTPIPDTNQLTVVVRPASDQQHELVKLNLVGGTLKDAAGNALANANQLASQAIDTKAPSVTSVVLSGSPSTAGVYKAGDVITATVEMSEDVLVTGTPQFALNFGNGQTRQATYVTSESDANNTLVFKYTVQPTNDNSSDGIAYTASALNLPSGSALKDATGNNAVLAVTAAAANSSFKVDSVAPTVRITSSLDQLDVINPSDTVVFTFSEDPGTSFKVEDIKLIGGTLKDLTRKSADGAMPVVYQATFTVEDGFRGMASVSVGNGTFQDAAGNLNLDGNSNAKLWSADSNAPSVTLAQATLGSNGLATVSMDEPGTVYLVPEGCFDFRCSQRHISVGRLSHVRFDTGWPKPNSGCEHAG
jgi:hypothetical protein